MARNNLSRHEELRYEYLLKNLQYLNGREKQEFDFLHNKKISVNHQNYQNNYDSSRNSRYDGGYDDYRNDDKYYDNNQYDNNQYTSQGLLKYPEEQPRLTRSSRNKQFQEEETLPFYGEEEYYQEPEIPKPKKPKKPRKKIKVKRILQFLALLIVLIVVGMGYMFFKGMNDVTSGETNYAAAVTETFNGEDAADGTNILILGSDQRISQGSSDARTDTIMVMNIGNSDGKIKLVSFMRDTLVNIPGVSYSDYSNDQKLNVAFNIGEQDNNQGAELMRQTLKDNFDINIKYYVMLDFETFAEAIDTLFPDGVTIDAKFGTVDGEAVSSVDVPDDLSMDDSGNVPDQTIAVGEQQMNGQTLLNYARFRKDDDGDYGRTTRQQQVVTAIINQIKDPTKLFTGSAAIGKIFALTSTNISYPFLLKEGLSVVSSGQEGIEQITVPSEGDWVDEYDMYGGLGLSIDFDKYQSELSNLGLR